MKDQSEANRPATTSQNPSRANGQNPAQPQGVAWQFYVVITIIGVAVLILVAKLLGIF